MANSGKRGLFGSVFGSKKKTEEQLEAERELHRKLEDRIREVLVVKESPRLESVLESECETIDTTEVEPAASSSLMLAPGEPEYSFLRPVSSPEMLRKSPSPARYRPAFEPMASAQASQAR